jgi:hypothetical protein
LKILEIFLLLAVALLGALIAHAALSRLTKALLWAWSPLTRDEVEVHVYQRAVYRTADPTLRPVLGAVAAAGLAWGLGLVWHSAFSSWLMFAGVMAIMAALVMDIQRWERVAVTANSVWFQRGFGHNVHQISLNQVMEVLVQEKDEQGATLRRWRNNRSARLTIRMPDKRLVSLPKTDAFSGLRAIEKMANFLHHRLQQSREASVAPLPQRRELGSGVPPMAVRPAATQATPGRPGSRAAVAPAPPQGVVFPVLRVELEASSPDEEASLQRAISRLLKIKPVPHSQDKAWAETQILMH